MQGRELQVSFGCGFVQITHHPKKDLRRTSFAEGIRRTNDSRGRSYREIRYRKRNSTENDLKKKPESELKQPLFRSCLVNFLEISDFLNHNGGLCLPSLGLCGVNFLTCPSFTPSNLANPSTLTCVDVCRKPWSIERKSGEMPSRQKMV